MLIREGKSMGKFGVFQGYQTLPIMYYHSVIQLRKYSLIRPFHVAHDRLAERNERNKGSLSGLKISNRDCLCVDSLNYL